MKYLELDNYITKLTVGRCIRIIQIKYSYRCEYNIFLFGCDHDYYEYLLNELSNILVNIETIDFDEDKINSILFEFMIEVDDYEYLELFKKEFAYELISFKELEKEINKMIPKDTYTLERYAYDTYGKYVFKINNEYKNTFEQLSNYLNRFGKIYYSKEINYNDSFYKIELFKEYSSYSDYNNLWNNENSIIIKKVYLINGGNDYEIF